MEIHDRLRIITFMGYWLSCKSRFVYTHPSTVLSPLFFTSPPQFTKKTNQDIVTLRESLKVSEKAIDDLKNTLKQFMTNTQRILTIESRKSSENDIAHLIMTESQKSFFDRVKFLEDIYRYEYFLGKPYSKERHISGKIMGKLMELCILNLDDYDSERLGMYRIYRYGHQGHWNSWITHATEEDLFEYITSIYRRDTLYNLSFPFVQVTLSNRQNPIGDNYRLKVEALKKATDSWFLAYPSNIADIPGKCKTFAAGYFNRVENVLTKIHKMGLLK